MGLQYLLADEGWEFCHNTIFPSTNDKANSWNGITDVMNKLLSMYSIKNLCFYSLCPVLPPNPHIDMKAIF
jgi:hypothetical protein